MDRDTIRRRGWSIHSEATHQSTATDNSLTTEEKRALLNSFPSMDNDDDEGIVRDGDPHHRHHINNNQDDDDNKSNESEGLFDDHDETSIGNGVKGNKNGGDTEPNSKSEHVPTRKRRKLEEGGAENIVHVETSGAPTRQLGRGTVQLSKWATRLFDPTRIKGVLAPPATIPLNDEFLVEFGKSEKEFDSMLGRKLEIKQAIVDDDGWSDDDEVDPNAAAQDTVASTKGFKIKIANLAFSTTAATLEKACARFGAVKHVNLLMDKERDNINVGRAYATFETEESAAACMENLTKLDGRSLRISDAVENPNQGNKRSIASVLTRYWERDISTKCHRCGKVGHIEAQCPNEAIPKPCPLCAKRGHDMRDCPFRQFCFNCGIPGHVSRDCPQQRGQTKRMVCGICFQTGHHRVGCWKRASEAPSYDAICMVCNKKGHFTCQEMKWFFGLDGVSCFNCGMKGHTGYNCESPGLDACARDDSVAIREVEAAEANSLADELERQKNRGRDRDRSSSHTSRDRPRSEPPRQEGRYVNDHASRFSSPQPPRSRQESRGGGQGQRRGYALR